MWPQREKTEELLAGVKAGDESAVNQLMERHRDSLRRIVKLPSDSATYPPQLAVLSRIDAVTCLPHPMLLT